MSETIRKEPIALQFGGRFEPQEVQRFEYAPPFLSDAHARHSRRLETRMMTPEPPQKTSFGKFVNLKRVTQVRRYEYVPPCAAPPHAHGSERCGPPTRASRARPVRGLRIGALRVFTSALKQNRSSMFASSFGFPFRR